MVHAICRGRRVCRPVGGSAAAVVGADRIRPQHKAPLQGACAGSTYSSTLQGVYAHPGACEKPGLRADSIRPYKAYAFIRVLPEIRGCGRILSAPTGRMRSSGCFLKSGVTGGFYPPLRVRWKPGAGGSPDRRPLRCARIQTRIPR